MSQHRNQPRRIGSPATRHTRCAPTARPAGASLTALRYTAKRSSTRRRSGTSTAHMKTPRRYGRPRTATDHLLTGLKDPVTRCRPRAAPRCALTRGEIPHPALRPPAAATFMIAHPALLSSFYKYSQSQGRPHRTALQNSPDARPRVDRAKRRAHILVTNSFAPTPPP